MDKTQLQSEIQYKAVRSSGAGGQNVNKVSSKVVLSFDLKNTQGLNEEQKQLVATQLQTRLTADGILNLSCDEDRSQLRNKELVTKRFFELVKKALIVPKERKPTKIPKGVIRKRIKDKKSASEVKKNRRKPDF
ncbi:alternative ribosome rescue aminoacyl-tRNA hydrolase ArfB [Flavobacterium turcicum]|uniref:Aminoacyl-tRNA hydrolase n=1 Tax=Flavobacterium turcicum TaxID=2764718 RepID=A0ABR7JD67_9FLAO|nr:alternative ribosome rescue aminoacyl-tRNA hydrolase ArfB [Flavobacterium turcicum]MBC5862298.1 aminoacyl-tRNA hydrolase [Flavobacterium turcicum]NHL01029.1 aminoacyl-tRNA hydrolase [Flavobacterium turcicum]